MANQTAERFMQALKTIEKENSIEAIRLLFSDEAELQRLSKDTTYKGKEGVERFWHEYLNSFRTLETTFHNVIEGSGTVVLEWESSGELPNGKPLNYSGVSVLELQGDKVERFRTYYDSATFVPEGATA